MIVWANINYTEPVPRQGVAYRRTVVVVSVELHLFSQLLLPPEVKIAHLRWICGAQIDSRYSI